jgi:hypothetical protein
MAIGTGERSMREFFDALFVTFHGALCWSHNPDHSECALRGLGRPPSILRTERAFCNCLGGRCRCCTSLDSLVVEKKVLT